MLEDTNSFDGAYLKVSHQTELTPVKFHVYYMFFFEHMPDFNKHDNMFYKS